MITDSLQRFRQRGNHAYIGDCLGTLGLLKLIRGEIAEALTIFQEVMTIGTTYGLPVELAIWQPLLGIVTLYGGNAAEARYLLEQGLRVCLDMKNTRFLARACTLSGRVGLVGRKYGRSGTLAGAKLSLSSHPTALKHS